MNNRTNMIHRCIAQVRDAICLALLLSAGCSSSTNIQHNAKPLDSVSGSAASVALMLNWYPEAEHGGFYAAKVHGIFLKNGLDVDIRPGGPNAPVAQELVTGRVQFGVGNADDVLLFQEQDAKIIALLAPIQNTPRCVLVREDSGIKGLDGLKGVMLQANKGQAFLDFMQSKGLLEGVQVVPYPGTVTKLVTDPNTAIQAYSFSEPLVAEQQGVKVRSLMLSDIGFNPYASCLIATEDYANSNPDLINRMAQACKEGWVKYLEAPDETNDYILTLNEQGLTKEALTFGVEKLRPLCLPDGMTPDSLGQMSLERWTELVDQFASLKLITPSKVKAAALFR